MEWQALYWAAASGAVIFSMLLTWQAFEHRRYARSRSKHRPLVSETRHVALYVPCKGSDDDLAANLRPLFEQDHPDYEIVFIVESDSDPAAAAIRALMREYSQMSSRLVVAGISTDTGQKVHNLLVATECVSPGVEILVFVDADVRPPRDWLRLLTNRLCHDSVSTGYRYFVPKRATLPNLVLSALNGAVVPIMFPGKHHLIWGGSWAITRELFQSSGMREAWRGTLSDDLMATRVMAREGEKVVAEPLCILPSHLDVTWRELFSFVRRQLIIGRCYASVHWYALLFGSSLMAAIFWGSLLAAVGGSIAGSAWAWRPALAIALIYGLHVWRASLRADAARHYLPGYEKELRAVQRFDRWLGPVANVVGWLGLVSSASSNRIVWKGIAYDMRPGGAITKIERPTSTSAASGVTEKRKAA